MTTIVEALVQQDKDKLSNLESILDFRFTDLRLLQQALIHSSFAFERSQIEASNETLEFLGDAVLDLVIGHILYKNHSQMREGELTKFRAALVNESHLAEMARKISLGDYLYLGQGEEASSGRNKSSILSSAFEAVVGAVFEDGGYGAAEQMVDTLFSPAIEGRRESLLVGDAKSRLQEILQSRHNEAPSYRLDREEGPSHKKLFTASVVFQDEVLGTGQAGSKKEAEQQAASYALKKLEVAGK